ncbi:MAG: Abi family protein [Desulfobacteraceae bacterium]
MNSNITEKLSYTLSAERINGYKKRIIHKYGKCNGIDCYVYYNWNTALCESFYCSLQALEVALRNAIHNTASEYFNNSRWFEDPEILDKRALNTVKQAKAVLIKQDKNTSAGRILAELNFGFWTSLFNKKYDQILWHKIIKKTFPYIKAEIRTRSTLSKRLNSIRRLRNRIFHYEPIWYYNDLHKHHDRIIETIGWMEPLMENMIFPIDQFRSCYTSKKLEQIRSELHPLIYWKE